MKKKDYRSLAYTLAQAVGLLEDTPEKMIAKRQARQKAAQEAASTEGGGSTGGDPSFSVPEGLAKRIAANNAEAARKKAAAAKAENQSTELFTRDPRVDEIMDDALGFVKKGLGAVGDVAKKAVGAVGDVTKKAVGAGAGAVRSVAGAVLPRKKDPLLAHTAYSQLGHLLFQEWVAAAVKFGKPIISAVAKDPKAKAAAGEAGGAALEALKRKRADKLAAKAAPEAEENASTKYDNSYVNTLMETARGGTISEEESEAVKKGNKKVDKAVEAARQKAEDDKRAEIHKRQGFDPKDFPMGGLTHSTNQKPPEEWESNTLGDEPKKTVPKKTAPDAPKPPKRKDDNTVYKRMGHILAEKAGRDLSPLTEPFEKISASEVAAAKPARPSKGERGIDPQIQADVAAEAAKTKARLQAYAGKGAKEVEINPPAGDLLRQDADAEKAASKKSGKRPKGRGHGTPNPIQPSRD